MTEAEHRKPTTLRQVSPACFEAFNDEDDEQTCPRCHGEEGWWQQEPEDRQNGDPRCC